MKVGLFVPCYIDQLYPQVGKASLELLEKTECEVIFLEDILCCGQPMDNSGFQHYTDKNNYATPFLEALPKIDYLVVPSASCAYHLTHHLLKEKTGRDQLDKIREITEFLHDLKPNVTLGSHFPHRVGLHESCHGLRGLELAKASELGGSGFSKIENLLNKVHCLELVKPSMCDECCGFGGSFSVFENAISVRMGEDKMKNVQEEALEFLTATDMSCLMHLEGVFNKNNAGIKVLHITEILNSQL
ncbi:(Fe-S)-binding protein [Antarcticibacterium sp. 1MA-6-2]|uniref:(Fe-S)-binding protein n=1 Tax=Antarcticibacterium sp. 1MA-6-2 TaxID=2908210 RepID=UPI001F3F7F78|nr:(Fe-S)-binding protein [Antarcticibacterium sp. 1MA-6-2]UJH90714.1 (Fe-S)-binding protein [Antarcticibacterium sp. 1MA-6-2]